jgi:hypothetical protein
MSKGAAEMIRRLGLFFVLCWSLSPQNISKAQGDETKIIGLENLWNQMQLQHDANAMAKLLDGYFVFTQTSHKDAVVRDPPESRTLCEL